MDPDLERAGQALRQLALACEHYRHTAAQYLGLDYSQTQAVSHLYRSGDLGQSELGILLGINTSSVTALIDRMESSGIARRAPHPTDRRRSMVQLTESGRAVVTRTAGWFYGAFDHIDPAELGSLTTTLSGMATDLERHTVELGKAERLEWGRADKHQQPSTGVIAE